MLIPAAGFQAVQSAVDEHGALLRAAEEGEKPVWHVRLLHPQIPWGNEDFHRALSSMGIDASKADDEVLEVRSQQLCLRIRGLKNIMKYCYTDSLGILPKESYEWFKRSSMNVQVMSSGDRFKQPVCLSVRAVSVFYKESSISDGPSNRELDEWLVSSKSFIMTKSLIVDDFIIEMQRKSSNLFTTMRESDITRTRADYNFKVCINIDKVPNAMDVFSNMVYLAQCIEGIEYPMSMDEMNTVRAQYKDLVKTVMAPKEERRILAEPFTPKPVTFERKHMLPIEEAFGDPTIQEGYAVTEKADGERMLLFINEEGKAFFLNNTLDVIALDLKLGKVSNTLVDGEYIANSKEGPLFAVFDAYFINGLPVYHKPLEKRMAEVGALQLELSKGTPTIMIKRHLIPNRLTETIFDKCAEILNAKKEFPYKIDGLIFTPTDLGVFAQYPLPANTAAPKLKNLIWTKVIKWKPADQNTIDFLVKTDNVVQIEPRTGRKFIELKLYIRYGLPQHEMIDVFEGLKLSYDDEYRSKSLGYGGARQVYVARRFEPLSYFEKGVDTAYMYVDADGAVYTESKERIEDNMIIEFSYDYDAEKNRTKPMSWRWIPKRVRDDKTRKYLSGLQSSGATGPAQMPAQTANSMLGALSVWRSIHEPVSESNIQGTDLSSIFKSIGTEPTEDDVYYRRSDRSRDEQVLTQMNNFHNLGVKQMLFSRSKKRGALLELACGKGSDMGRWRFPEGPCKEGHGPYRFVLGIDYSKDNIQNPSDGCYARFTDPIRSPVHGKKAIAATTKMYEDSIVKPDYVFVVGDCTRDLASGEAARTEAGRIIDSSSFKMLKFLYGKDRTVPIEIQNAFRKKSSQMLHLQGRAAQGFDVISCMFAVHYFCKSRETLEGFFRNVRNNLKENGIFIATFMDGNKVMQQLRRAAGGSDAAAVPEYVMIEGNLKDARGNRNPQYRLWAIKAHKDLLNLDGDIKVDLGQEIDVFVESINKLTPEYLVNYDVLRDVADKHDLEEVESEMFGKLLHKLANEKGNNDALTTAVENLMKTENEAIREFSEFNRWAIFRRKLAPDQQGQM